ncbi:MAG: DUF4097 domain-containing protein, partial [Oscillospiraceae bacterium]|nr:DUF4097 domain-containing protein [Oscillospiraceae bacterium]
MSKTKIITITCWIISALALIGLAIWLLVSSLSGAAFSAFSGNFSLGINLSGTENLTGVFDIQGTYTADVADINSIKINWVAGDITVTPYNGDVVQITESAQRQLQDNERFFMNTSGSTLNIRFTEKNRFRRMPQKKLELLVPQSLSDSLQLLDISSVSSKIGVKDLQAASLDFNSVSGAIEISNISSDSIKLNSTSG